MSTQEIVIASIVAFVVVVGLALLLFRPKKKRDISNVTLPSTLKPLQKIEPVQLPKSQAEIQFVEAAENAKKRAEETRAQREALKKKAKEEGDRLEKEKLENEARALKEKEEEAKRAAYNAQKQAEAEEKERKQKEREEAERLEKEQLAKQADEEAQRQLELKRAEEEKIKAQSGKTLLSGLEKTRKEGFIGRLNGLFGRTEKTVDESVLAELEEILFTADIGVKTASNLVHLAREKANRKELKSSNTVKELIRHEIERIVDLRADTSLKGGGPPHVIMVVGVNGAGKTTTIGKLAAKAKAQGLKVVLAAGDTFRAAAAEQLDVWAERAGAELVTGKENADPASVIFDAVKKAKEMNADLVIADTAGRLHTKANLMEELKKVRRVIDKALPGAPHEVLLVMDSTMGQNGIAQARQFHDAVSVTSIALTKLDGTAKGGVVIGICDDLKVPVSWVGVGEQVADLRAFAPKEFVAALFDEAA